jgi:hypothetical protein
MYMDNVYLLLTYLTVHTKGNKSCGTVRPNQNGMPTNFRRKLRPKWGDIKTRVNGDLTATVWKDKQNRNIDKYALQQKIISVMSMEMQWWYDSYSFHRHTWKLMNKLFFFSHSGRWGSSASIVSGYRLDDQTIKVRTPAGAKDSSSSLCVQTSSGAYPTFCTMGTGGPFPEGKVRPGRDVDHSPPSTAEVANESELYLLSPQAPPWRPAGLLYFLLFSHSK